MDVVWQLLRDYRAPRARMFSESFAEYELHHGGVGAGTVIGYRLRVGRHERAFVLGVEEPTRVASSASATATAGCWSRGR